MFDTSMCGASKAPSTPATMSINTATGKKVASCFDIVANGHGPGLTQYRPKLITGELILLMYWRRDKHGPVMYRVTKSTSVYTC